MEHDDLDQLADEIRKLIDSNKAFLERVNDEDYEDEDEAGDDPEPAEDLEEYEEL